jgi:diguanylate cyclase (GGDEF)-like protein
MSTNSSTSNGRRGVLERADELLLDCNPHPAWFYDSETLAIHAVNRAAVGRYGYSEDEFRSLTTADLEEASEASLESILAAEDRSSSVALARHRTKAGAVLDVELASHEIPFRNDAIKLMVATDVTGWRRGRQELENRAAQQADVARLGSQALEGMELGELIEEAAEVVARTLATDFSEVLERCPEQESLMLRAGVGWDRDLFHKPLVPIGSAFYTGFTLGSLGQVVVEDFAEEKRFQATQLLRDREVVSGASVIIGRRGRPFGLLGAFSRAHRRFGPRDVDFLKAVGNVIAGAIERKRSEEEIRRQALHDPLTGLPNRTLLLERLEHWLARSQRTDSRSAVLFIDLDHFKVVNDALGHPAGDRLLLEAAARLEQVVRPTDTVARIGGDEFVIFCEDIESQHAALELPQRLLEALAAPFELGDAQRHISASIGLVFAESGAVPEDLVRDADSAMYRAKERGGARVELFDAAMRERSLRWLEMEAELRRAIDEGQLYNLYQPVVATSGPTIGFEALVRWRHPERGVVSPADFIPIAEESGLIIPLGERVLDDACREAVSWPPGPDGRALSININLSARQVAHPGVVAMVASALERSGLEPVRLNLEITETVLIKDTDTALETLEALKGLGVGLVLDDFGTGYSSLGHVKRFPIDMLKIDRAFVGGLGEDTEDDAIVSAILSMGRALDVPVVAEGVETAEQAGELRSRGCPLAQGFYFARPLTPDDAARHISSR